MLLEMREIWQNSLFIIHENEIGSFFTHVNYTYMQSLLFPWLLNIKKYYYDYETLEACPGMKYETSDLPHQ
jgi:hypothetical protein